MAEKRPLDVLPAPAAAGGMDRRAALRALAGGIGAGVALPGVAASHPVHRHLSDASALAEAETAAAAGDWKPVYLDRHQSGSLVSLAEQILPGSTSAGVSRFVDQLLSVDTQENQRRFLQALGAFDGESIRRFGRPWKSLAAAQQVELLTAASEAAPAARDAKGQPGPPTLRDHFDHLKGWISGAYFSSEIGMRELGWTGNVFHAGFPGCQHPDGHR